MKRFALTGGIASGKSMVAHLLRQAQVPVVDADQLARKVVEKGTPGLLQIENTFGKTVLTENGELDRKKVGELIFSSPEKRKTLEKILHPLIAQAGTEEMDALENEGHSFGVYEAALIFENNLENAFDATILVSCNEATQIKRLMQRDGLSRELAQARIDTQMPMAEKRNRTKYLIENNDTEDQLKKQIISLWKVLTSQDLQPLL